METAALIVAMTALGHPHATAADLVRERILAAIIIDEAAKNRLSPVLVAAVIARESMFNPKAIGAKGERGLMQLLPRGSALAHYKHLAPAALESPRINLAIGALHMAHVRDLCGGAPIEWLSVYNGHSKCRWSRYSRAVVDAWVRAEHIEARTKWASSE